MGRRTRLGLLVALAVLLAPAATSLTVEQGSSDAHAATRITAPDRHATIVHVVAPSLGGRERRTPQHPTSSPAVLGGAAGLAPAVAWAHLDTPSTSPTGVLSSSARPRAPPAVV